MKNQQYLLKMFSLVLFALIPFDARTDTKSSEQHLRISVAATAARSGVIEALAATYEAEHPGIRIDVSAAGGLSTLDHGRDGLADAVITHDPPGEEQFMAEGYGASRTLLMYSQFAFFGPPDDPLELSVESDPLAVLQKLRDAKADFYVPGIRSSTYTKLAELFSRAQLQPNWVGYEVTGASAPATLRMAALLEGYTFADMATYLSSRETLAGPIVPLFRDHVALRNYYSYLVVSRAKVPQAEQQLAERFLEFLVSAKGQALISHFGERDHQAQLYVPAAHLDRKVQDRFAELRQQSRGLVIMLVLVLLLAAWALYRAR